MYSFVLFSIIVPGVQGAPWSNGQSMGLRSGDLGWNPTSANKPLGAPVSSSHTSTLVNWDVARAHVSQRPSGRMGQGSFCYRCWGPGASKLVVMSSQWLLWGHLWWSMGFAVCFVKVMTRGMGRGIKETSGFTLRLVTREEQAEMCKPNCYIEMYTWSQCPAYLPIYTVSDHLSSMVTCLSWTYLLICKLG